MEQPEWIEKNRLYYARIRYAYRNFTAHFLDEIIRLVQWEDIKNVTHKKERCNERDDSRYQDYKKVVVDVQDFTNAEEFDLILSPAQADNVFMKVLKLIWEEYGEILEEKGLVVLWFYRLGWKE